VHNVVPLRITGSWFSVMLPSNASINKIKISAKKYTKYNAIKGNFLKIVEYTSTKDKQN